MIWLKMTMNTLCLDPNELRMITPVSGLDSGEEGNGSAISILLKSGERYLLRTGLDLYPTVKLAKRLESDIREAARTDAQSVIDLREYVVSVEKLP